MSSMVKKQQLLPVSLLTDLDSQTVGYDVLRYISLPQLLGQETDTLLYYMGRNLARAFDIKTLEDVYFMFDKLGWGRLEPMKERKNWLVFSLMAVVAVKRIKALFQT